MHIHAHCVKLTTLCVSKNFDCAIKIFDSHNKVNTSKTTSFQSNELFHASLDIILRNGDCNEIVTCTATPGQKKKLIHLDGIHKKYIMRVNNLIVISIIQV